MRSIVLFAVCASASALLALSACKKSDSTEDPGTGEDSGTTPPEDANFPDFTKREAGVPKVCAIFQGSTSNDACSCGETTSPFTGPPTTTCPPNANPYYCVSYAVNTPKPYYGQCSCQPKCLFQHVAGSGGGDGGGGGVDTCRCGVASHLVLGGDGSKDDPRPTCEGYKVCCKDNTGTGCDCTNDTSYACPSTSTKVDSCTPADFSTEIWKAEVYGDPMYSNLVDVDRCL